MAERASGRLLVSYIPPISFIGGACSVFDTVISANYNRNVRTESSSMRGKTRR